MSGPRFDTGEWDGSAEERIQYALEQIEGAQMLLGAASANLSPIIGLVKLHQRTMKLYADVHAFWYRLNGALEKGRGKLRLDGINEAARVRRAAGGAQ